MQNFNQLIMLLVLTSIPTHLFSLNTLCHQTAEYSTIIINLENLINPLCYGDLNGSIDIRVIGGIAPYTYDWDNDGIGDNDDSEDLQNLGAGTYNITATDAANNTVSLAVTLTEPPYFSISAPLAVAVTCYGTSQAYISVFPSGGTPPYTYDWDNDGVGDNDDAQEIGGLSAGTYSLTVMDANGCTRSHSRTVYNLSPLALVWNTITPACASDNGKATSTLINDPTIDPALYDFEHDEDFLLYNQYLWSNGDTYSPDLAAGTYGVTVTADGSGCTAVSTVTIPEDCTICRDTLLLENTMTSPLYRVYESITSYGTVATGNAIDFKAGETIILQNGFKVEPQAAFSAEIEDCN